MVKYIDQVTNVTNYGNCGFRSVALLIHGSEDEWLRVRHEMLADVRNRRDLYHHILNGITTVNALEFVIYHNGVDKTEPNKWMALPECGHVVATAYNVVFITYSSAGGYTFLPTILDPTEGSPTTTVVLGNVHGNHFILLHMIPGDYPMPPIAPYWHLNHDSSTNGLDLQFQHRINTYNDAWNADSDRRRAATNH